jgi:hypothetical protein
MVYFLHRYIGMHLYTQANTNMYRLRESGKSDYLVKGLWKIFKGLFLNNIIVQVAYLIGFSSLTAII